MRRLVLRFAVTFTALTIALGCLGLYLVRHNLPDREAPRIPGLSEKVSVSFDDRGVALVRAASLPDALRVQGYLTARERLFQMEVQRRAAAGELSEIFGSAALPLDRIHRTYGFARVAEAAVPLLPEDERASLVALADGINTFLSSHHGRLGVEFTLLQHVPRPFTAKDSLLVLLLMYEDLTSTWRRDAARERLLKLPESVRAFVASDVTRDDVTLVADSTPPGIPDVPSVSAAAALKRATPEDETFEGVGSNNWAVSGRFTKSGKPMLANDPHLGIAMPAIWLPMRFEIAGRRVEGVTLPGMPGVVLGKNDRLAWAFTNLEADVEDLYREPRSAPRTCRDEAIAVRGKAADVLRVCETRHGPIVEGDLALKWTALDARNVRLPTASVMLTSTPEELDAAFERFLGPAQNVVWASLDGSIGWHASGLLPIRRAGTDGSVPYDGADPENDWKGFIPVSAMPRVVNPQQGFVATANQRTIGTSFPYAVRFEATSPTRARRIRDLIEKAKADGRKLDRADFESIQLDAVSEPLRRFVQPFVPLLPADLSNGFTGWDGRAAERSSAFLLARTLRSKLRDRALAAWHVEGWSGSLAEDLAADLANADDAAFRRAGLGEKRAFLEGCVRDALGALEKRFGKDRSRWAWGEANRLDVHHALGRIPGLSFLFDPPRAPVGGAPQTVRAQTPTHGPSMRFVLDWGDPRAATLVVPFGVSGHLGSPHRLDQFALWLHGDPAGGATRLARESVGEAVVFAPE